jgi:hypothetical protein
MQVSLPYIIVFKCITHVAACFKPIRISTHSTGGKLSKKHLELSFAIPSLERSLTLKTWSTAHWIIREGVNLFTVSEQRHCGDLKAHGVQLTSHQSLPCATLAGCAKT